MEQRCERRGGAFVHGRSDARKGQSRAVRTSRGVVIYYDRGFRPPATRAPELASSFLTARVSAFQQSAAVNIRQSQRPRVRRGYALYWRSGLTTRYMRWGFQGFRPQASGLRSMMMTLALSSNSGHVKDKLSSWFDVCHTIDPKNRVRSRKTTDSTSYLKLSSTCAEL